MALNDAGVAADDLDVVELHDAFTVEDSCTWRPWDRPERQGGQSAGGGPFDIGGRVAVSASGGLLSMGHPIGPTGVGQICEITHSCAAKAASGSNPGRARPRPHVGIGAVCLVHVLAAPDQAASDPAWKLGT